jgi:Spy/CpxP family protein refolding chaperone
LIDSEEKHMSRTAALVLTLTLLFGFTLAAQTAPPAASSTAPQTPQSSAQALMNEPTPQAQAHETIEKVGTDLNLTADQKSKLEPVLTAEIQQVRDLRSDTTMTIQQKQAKFQQTMTDTHAKIDAILTPEQKQKLAVMSQQRAQQQQQQAAPPSASPAPSQTPSPSQGPSAQPSAPPPQSPK